MGRKRSRGSHVFAIHYIDGNVDEVYPVEQDVKTMMPIGPEMNSPNNFNNPRPTISIEPRRFQIPQEFHPIQQNLKIIIPIPDIRSNVKATPSVLKKSPPNSLKNLPASIVMWLNNPEMTLLWNDIEH